MCQTCGGSNASASTTSRGPDQVQDRPVVATIRPGFEATVNYRLLPTREIPLPPHHEGCQPRQVVALPPSLATSLTPELVATLQDANRSVVAWLKKDESHSAQFLADPVASLRSAGVELSRADEKALSRSHAAVRAESVLPPGATITDTTARADARGKVGDGGSGRPSTTGTSTAPTTDANC
jgi:hypothetical protein